MGDLTINKLITIILIVLVIATIFLFIFKPEIREWFKNVIPDYNYGKDETIDISGQQDEQTGIAVENRIGKSQVMKLVFDKGINDEIFILWNYDVKRAEIVIRPNGDKILVDGKEKLIYSAGDSIFSDEAMDKIYPEDINLIKGLFDANSLNDFAVKIKNILNTKQASVNNDGNYDMSSINIEGFFTVKNE